MNYLNGWKFPFPHKWKNQIKLTIWVEECSYAVISFSFYISYILSIDIDMFLNYILWFDFVNLLMEYLISMLLENASIDWVCGV